MGLIAFLSLSLSVHIKRKMRRRPSWGRGIIRKKRIYRKEREEEEEEEGGEEEEAEVPGPSDSCLTQDEESSCDTAVPRANGLRPHGPSTEEESSNEPPAEPPDASERPDEPTPKEEEEKEEEELEAKEAEPESTGGGGERLFLDGVPEAERADGRPPVAAALSVPPADCVNGHASMDSLDSSQSVKRSGEAEKRSPPSATEGSGEPEREEHKDEEKEEEGAPTREERPREGMENAEEEELNPEGTKMESKAP